MKGTEKLRTLLELQDACIQLPGCHDALGAKLIQEAGFSSAYLSGFALSATRLAAPDVGLATYNEMVEVGRACCEAVSIPVIGDGDTGYGGVLNVRRTVHGYARAGLAAVSIEDQKFPKRCSYSSGVQIVSRDDALERIRAALKARDEIREREGLDILIIARTDCARANPPAGGERKDMFDEALARCLAFQAAGADIVYAEGLETQEEMRALTGALSVPTMLAQVERPDAALVTAAQAKALGFKLYLVLERCSRLTSCFDLRKRGVTLLNAQITATKRALAAMRNEVDLVVAPSAHMCEKGAGRDLMTFAELYQAVGFPEAYEWERSLHQGAREGLGPSA